MKSFPKINICLLPTPIHKLENISRDTGVDIYIKRDDMTGFGLGGNKLRKLEYLAYDAIDNHCDTLLTYGGPQTNHGRLTAAVATRLGMKCIIIADGEKPDRPTGNLILDKMMGADLYFTDAANEKESLTAKVVRQYEENGHKIYNIPIGGSSVIGAIGYFEAVKEINTQLDEMKLSISNVICAYGSAGTYAGLILGQKYHHTPYEVTGVSVSHKTECDLAQHAAYINRVSNQLELGITIERKDMRIEMDYVKNGYNVPDKETRDCVYYVAKKEAIILDPCYTGKAFNGLLNLIRKNVIPQGSSVLFIHTGGVPGIYSDTHMPIIQEELWW